MRRDVGRGCVIVWTWLAASCSGKRMRLSDHCSCPRSRVTRVSGYSPSRVYWGGGMLTSHLELMTLPPNEIEVLIIRRHVPLSKHGISSIQFNRPSGPDRETRTYRDAGEWNNIFIPCVTPTPLTPCRSPSTTSGVLQQLWRSRPISLVTQCNPGKVTHLSII